MARKHKRNNKNSNKKDSESANADNAVSQEQQQKVNNNNNKNNNSKKRTRDEQQQQQQKEHISSMEKAIKKSKKTEQSDDEEESDVSDKKPAIATKAAASTSEFSWSAFQTIIDNEKRYNNDNESDESDDSESDEEEQDEEAEDKQKNKSAKAQRKKLNEELVAEREKELVSENVLPETDTDFERLIAGSPNNSFLWIQYMAFKLANTDIEAARKIAERALKKINYREEQEKFNIFAAMMNLESKFGDEESQKKLFNRAVQYCEAKDVYLQQAKIHEQNEDDAKVHETYKKMMKKFYKSRKPYEAYEQYLVQTKQYKKANEILERSLKNLPKQKHLKAISKFAVIHYKFGSVIDGHQIFEQLTTNYPKRTDIWSMYIETEMNAGRVEQVRNLYERVVNLNLSTKKMQSFLKRYLRFEKEQGSEDGQEHVKQLARDYIAMKTTN